MRAPADVHSSHALCVAPMMAWTDRHCRVLHRLLSPHARLYTEMVTTGALLHGPRDRLLARSPLEGTVAFQLGGSEPADLAAAAELVTGAGFTEVNLNVGCPSERVQHGAFGACLMQEPHTVARCVTALRDASPMPVTVKCRLGVDDQDDYPFLARFVSTVARAGCRTFIVHARKAVLQRLTPAQNREVPPLDHARVHRLKREFPELTIVLNGGLKTPDDAMRHLLGLDGVMYGRAAYHSPWLLVQLEAAVFATPEPGRRVDVLARYAAYLREELERATPLRRLVAPLHGLFAGCRGAARFRRALDELVQEGRAAGITPCGIESALLGTAAHVLDPQEGVAPHVAAWERDPHVRAERPSCSTA